MKAAPHAWQPRPTKPLLLNIPVAALLQEEFRSVQQWLAAEL
jgi:hypothetical protein